MPLNGSSSISAGGSPSSAAAMPEPLAHAEREAAGPAPGHRGQPGLLEHLVDPAGAAGPASGPATAGGCGRSGSAAARRRPAASRRGTAAGAGVRYGRPPTSAVPASARVQAEDHPHRGGLAGAVRADEAGDLRPARTVNDIPSRARVRPEPLAQPGDDDGGVAHGASVLRGRPVSARCRAADTRADTRRPGMVGGMRVLVVEDFEILARTIGTGLRREGMAVDVVLRRRRRAGAAGRHPVRRRGARPRPARRARRRGVPPDRGRALGRAGC